MIENVTKYPYNFVIFADIICSVAVRTDKTGFYRRYGFLSLRAGDTIICREWENAVEWAEVFNGFCRNALLHNTKYKIIDRVVFDYISSDCPPTLRMFVENEQANIKQYSFSKFECLAIYSKISKILGKCDLIIGDGY